MTTQFSRREKDHRGEEICAGGSCDDGNGEAEYSGLRGEIFIGGVNMKKQ